MYIFHNYYPQKMLDHKGIVSKSSPKMDTKVHTLQSHFLKPNSYQRFPIQELLSNKALMLNKKYNRFIKILEEYNSRSREGSIVEYKMFQFLFASLKICNTKTPSEADDYLDIVESWFSNQSKKKRLKMVEAKVKKSVNQDSRIRQTFKSNLPLQINNYNRKLIYQLQTSPQSANSSQSIASLTFKPYKAKIWKMRQEREQKQQQKMRRQIKQQYSRLQSITNLYKRGLNRYDLSRQKINTYNASKNQPFSTTHDFHSIKNYRLNKIRRKSNNLTLEKDNSMKCEKSICSIDGLLLIKNPLDVKLKPKKKK